MEKRVIHLQPSECEKLSKLVRNGKIEADIVKRAYMLLHGDAGISDVAIAAFLLCSEDTVRPALPLRRAHAKRRDEEYQRCGTRNVFLFLEPKAGKRHTLVTRRRTKEDWAKAMLYLVDELYPTAERIDVVLDDLNTHTYKAPVP